MSALSDAKAKAQQDLFEAISKEVPTAANLTAVGNRAEALRKLALAYRYAAGGAQPGGGVADE